MNIKALIQSRSLSTPSFSPAPVNMVQRKCACGGSTDLIGECAECKKKMLLGENTPIVQTKLKISQPNDKYEQEADRVADEVLRIQNPKIMRQVNSEGKEEEKEEEKELQRKELPGHTAVVTPQSQDRINGLCGGGHSLPESVLAFYNSCFGTDFSMIRIHTGPVAAETARSVNARAFTHDRNIFFDQGEFQPNTNDGKRLLAHELTHTLQQRAASVSTTLRRAPAKKTNDTLTSTIRRKVDVTVVSGDTKDPQHDRAEAIAKGRLATGESDIAIAIMKIEDIHNSLQLYAANKQVVPQERINKWKQSGDFFLVPDDHPGFVHKLSIIGHGKKGTKSDEPFYQFGEFAYKTSELRAMHKNGLDFSRYLVSGGTVILEGCDAAAGEPGRMFLFQIGQIFFGSKKRGRIKANTEKSMAFAGKIIGGSPRALSWPEDFSDLLVQAPSPQSTDEPTRHEEWRGGDLNVLLTWLPSGKVIGSYGDSGSITGSITGNRVLYLWRDKGAEGKGHWILSTDAQQLKGEFGYGDSESNGGQWNLAKQ